MALTPDQWHQMIRQAAGAYGTSSDLLQQINQREQGGRADFVVNDWDSNAAKGTPSGGPFQFIEPTFNAYARQARQANPQAWRGVQMSWRNPYAQALAASWAFANGKGKAWSTYGSAVNAVGGQVSGPRETRPAASSGVSGADRGAGSSDPVLGRQMAVIDSVFKDNSIVRNAVRASLERRAAQTAAQATGGDVAMAPAPDAPGAFVTGKIIGTPHNGTHTLGNWQSDNAIDISLKKGTPIYAVSDGVVVNPGTVGKGAGSGSGRFDGFKMTLKGGNNSWWYGHLDKMLVKAGQRVHRGQLIGYSGVANGVPHLHFGQMHGNPRYG